jgi:hypothetical protein
MKKVLHTFVCGVIWGGGACGWQGAVVYCAYLALSIQHAMCRSIVIRDLSGFAIFRHYLINGTIFEKKKKATENKVFDLIFFTTSI